MTSQTTGAKAPPPYLLQTNTAPAGDVKVYNLHTPFNPGESTIKDYSYQVQAGNLNSNEAKPKYTSYDTDLGRTAGMTTCTSCQTQVMTNISHKVGTYAILMCILFILCGLILGCCLIPFFVKFFKDVYHTCPRCNRVLHVEKKKCC